MEVRRAEAKTPKGGVTAGTESKTLVAANPSRVSVVITNVGEKDVFLCYGEGAAADEGPRLVAKTGSLVEQNYTGLITCITKEGESLVTFAEI